MLSLFIGVYKALYDYSAQSEEELTVETDDLLYLLEKSDIDEWWKVKKRQVATGDEEVEEPVGLVPSNYIEPAPAIKTAVALYDYDKQTEEELSFKEGERFNVYDLNDPDWLLVGDFQTQTQFGFVPANYIELEGTGAEAPMTPIAQQQPPQSLPQTTTAPRIPIGNFAPPPQHRDRASSSPAPAPAPVQAEREIENVEGEEEVASPYDHRSPIKQNRPHHYDKPLPVLENVNDDDDDAPPPMPSRPGLGTQTQSFSSAAGTPSRHLTVDDVLGDTPEHSFDGEFFTWYINEVDGRRKRAVTLSVGQGLIILKPTESSSKLSLKTASTINQQWKIRDLTDFSNEKKHVFLEFTHPLASIELHAGSKDVAEAILSIIGDLKGAESARGLREVARAAEPSTKNNKKIGRLMYDFVAQGDDELASKEGDEVYVINETKSKDWWMVENIDTGRQGVVPSSYIEIVGSSNLDKLTEQPLRKKSTKKTSKGRVVENKEKEKRSRHHRTRDERDRIRENDRIQRDKSSSKSHDKEHDKSMPNIHRVRTWIDSSGSFKVEAEFLGCVEGKIHLHKTNGVKIAVGATKLSLEDLEYVEKVTGTSLESYKEEVSRQLAKQAKAASNKQAAKQSGVSTKSAAAVINDIPPPQPSRPKATSTTAVTEPDYDWFEFFLSCGVDIGNCQRYSLNFSREQMDENVLQDISPSLLRTLGLREGDILRVMKALDAKFNRKSAASDNGATGSLFTEPTGALKNNNSAIEASKVNASALPSPMKSAELQVPSSNGTKFEDDAWAVKPAARSSEDLLKAQSPQPESGAPKYTGSLLDLVNIKPLELNAAPPAVQTPQRAQEPSAPALTPVKTGTLIQPGQQFAVQKSGTGVSTQPTGNFIPVQQTGGLVPVQKTGGFVPIQQTGGFIPAQPTGFMPIAAQPTGFMPIQATGGLVPQMTFGIVPLQTGATTFTQQKTGGGMPTTSFGQVPLQTGGFVPLQTGNVTIPQTSFNQLSMQRTGPLVPVQKTGGQPTGGVMPQTSFGQIQPVMGGQMTGGSVYTTPFTSQQPTGALNQFNQQPTGAFGQFNQPQLAPTTSFGGNMNPFPQQQQQPPQNTFGQFQPQQTSFNQFSQMPPQNSFGNNQFQQQMPPQNSFGQLVNQFQQQPFQQQTQPFQQPNIGQVTNMFQNTGISGAPPQQQFPNTSFGQQPQFDSFSPQPLQSQPTGAGFGNSPLQAQQTGRGRANLQAATADNPFGF